MHPLKAIGKVQGVGCGIFLFGFGVVFLLFGLMGGLPFILSPQPQLPLEFQFGFVVYILFGLFIVWGGLGQIILFSRIGRTTAGVFHDFLRPGDTFRVSFTQSFRFPVVLQTASAYLVYRESVTVPDSDGTTTRHFDRLVQWFEYPSGRYSGGQAFSAELRFQMPTRAMGLRYPYQHSEKKRTVTAGWVIKVHLVFGKGGGIWREYELPVMENIGPLARHNEADSEAVPQEPLFDVELVDVAPRSPILTTNAMKLFLPHLEGGQLGDLYFARPCLLRENLTQHEAETIKTALEAVGATVLITPAPPAVLL